MSGKKHKKRTNPPTSAPDVDDDDFEEDEDEDEYDEGDEDEDDDDEYEPGVDDPETLRLERERMEHADGRQWVEVSSTLSSITFAMPVYQQGVDQIGPRNEGMRGTVLLVKSWGLDGEALQSVAWLPGVSPEDLHHEPATITKILPASEE